MFQELSYRADGVSIVWEDGQTSDFHSLWLRDNDPANRDPVTGQRLIDVADLPVDAAIARAVPAGEALRVFWCDGAVASFPIAWLKAESESSAIPAPQLWKASHPIVLKRFSYPGIRESAMYRLEWLRAIATIGIAFLEDVPLHDGQALEIASLIGWVRETNYGRIFDVRAMPQPNNLAYTDLALGLHTDNPYREPVPGLQVLHALKAGKGGESLFGDGFAIADALREIYPAAFETLASNPVRFEFSDSQSRLVAERSIIEVDRLGAASAIHYNSRSIAPINIPARRISSFYCAYRSFALLLRSPEFVVSTSLRDGEAVVFDNRRVLHGRAAFDSTAPRHLQGCYLERDGLFSNLAILDAQARERTA